MAEDVAAMRVRLAELNLQAATYGTRIARIIERMRPISIEFEAAGGLLEDGREAEGAANILGAAERLLGLFEEFSEAFQDLTRANTQQTDLELRLLDYLYPQPEPKSHDDTQVSQPQV